MKNQCLNSRFLIANSTLLILNSFMVLTTNYVNLELGIWNEESMS